MVLVKSRARLTNCGPEKKHNVMNAMYDTQENKRTVVSSSNGQLKSVQNQSKSIDFHKIQKSIDFRKIQNQSIFTKF